MFDDRGRSLLTVAGTASAVLAVLHLAVIAAGPAGYRYFGAPDEFATLAESGSTAPAVLTGAFALIFAVWSVYAFAGARRIPRPPLVRLGLVLIASVYVLRGLSAIPEAILLLRTPDAFPARFLVFSLVSLAIGVFHALGVRQGWRRLSPRFRP
jgi:hypothetical protein